jgi:hypothetical protein
MVRKRRERRFDFGLPDRGCCGKSRGPWATHLSSLSSVTSERHEPAAAGGRHLALASPDSSYAPPFLSLRTWLERGGRGDSILGFPTGAAAEKVGGIPSSTARIDQRIFFFFTDTKQFKEAELL